MQDRSTNICDIENQRSMLCFEYKYIDSRYRCNVFDFGGWYNVQEGRRIGDS
jgi:hypothetical protein